MNAILLANEKSEEIQAWALLIMAITGAVVAPIVAIRAKQLKTELRGMKLSFDTQVPVATAAAEAAAAAVTTNTSKMDAMAAEVAEINTAVNRKAPHEPTLVKRVAGLEETVNLRVLPAINHLVKSDTNRIEWQRQMGSKLGITIETGETQ